MKRFLFSSLLLAGPCLAFQPELAKYPYPSDAQPRDYAQLSEAEKKDLRELTAKDVRMLFEAPCANGGGGCLWAYVQSLFQGKAVLRKTGSKQYTVYTIDQDTRASEWKDVRQFVQIAPFAEGIAVSGKRSLTRDWLQLEGAPAVPVLWLPVSDANQAQINHEFYQAMHEGRANELRLAYADLEARRNSAGKAYFVVLGYDMADDEAPRHQVVVYRHPQEAGTFTGVLRSGEVRGNQLEQIDTVAYTLTAERDVPRTLQLLNLVGEHKNTSLRGEFLR